MIYVKKHTVLVSSVVVLGLALLFALPQLSQQQDLRQRAQTTPSGNQLYVSPTGTGDCTQASPCSLATADSKATPGTTIIAASGTYTGNIAITKGGAAGSFVTYKSQEKHGATIVGGEENSAVDLKAPYVRFQDFTITGEKTRNGFIINADNIEIIGNHIHHITQWKTGGTGWQGGAGVDIGKSPLSNILIDGNLIDHVGAPGSTEQLVHGMYLSGHVTNGVVTNNVITDIEDFGLHPYDETEASGWQFINNTIVNTGRGILQAPNGVTRNNIVFNTRGAAYEIRGAGNVIENNLAGGTGSDGAANGSGVTKGDPMFVSASDYHLKPGSPAIDKGSAEGAPKTDYDGKTRPSGAGIDLGAFEEGGAAASPGVANPSGAAANPSSAVPPIGSANPSFYPLAPCPSCATPPITPVGSGSPVQQPSSIVQVPISGSEEEPEPSTVEPCEEDSSISDNHKKKSKHKNKKGGVSTGFEEILKLLIELINKLLELLGGQPIQTPQQSEDPIEPSQSEEPEPSAAAPANPC